MVRGMWKIIGRSRAAHAASTLFARSYSFAALIGRSGTFGRPDFSSAERFLILLAKTHPHAVAQARELRTLACQSGHLRFDTRTQQSTSPLADTSIQLYRTIPHFRRIHQEGSFVLLGHLRPQMLELSLSHYLLCVPSVPDPRVYGDSDNLVRRDGEEEMYISNGSCPTFGCGTTRPPLVDSGTSALDARCTEPVA